MNSIKKLYKKIIKKRNQNKSYKNMIKKYKKELTELNRDARTRPWDWSFGLDYLIAYMRFMQEYFTLRSEDEESDEWAVKAKDTLTETLNAYEDWQHCHLSEEYFSHTEDGAIEFIGDESVLKEHNKELNKRRKKFFTLLSKHIESWWS